MLWKCAMERQTASVPAQSNPEAEHLGSMTLTSEMDKGFETGLKMECDASSVIAIATRRDVGRLRHREVQLLWLQQWGGTGHWQHRTFASQIHQIKATKGRRQGVENLPDIGNGWTISSLRVEC